MMAVSSIWCASIAQIVELDIGSIICSVSVVLAHIILLVDEVFSNILLLLFVHHLVFSQLFINLVLNLVFNVVINHLMFGWSFYCNSWFWLLLCRCCSNWLLFWLIVQINAILNILFKPLTRFIRQAEKVKFKLLVVLIALDSIIFLNNWNDSFLLLGRKICHYIFEKLLFHCERWISALIWLLNLLILTLFLFLVLLFVFLFIFLFLFLTRIRLIIFIIFFYFAAILNCFWYWLIISLHIFWITRNIECWLHSCRNLIIDLDSAFVLELFDFRFEEALKNTTYAQGVRIMIIELFTYLKHLSNVLMDYVSLHEIFSWSIFLWF